MDKIDSIWEDLNILEHREKALEWAESAFPQFLGNEALIAQLYFTNEMDKNLPPPVDTITVVDLQEKFANFTPEIKPDGKESKLYASVEVVMVQMLDDSRGYFGCPKCYRKVDKNHGICTHIDHIGEDVSGTQLTFQKWQAGDNTGRIIVTFGPSNHQMPQDTQFYTLTLQGSMNNRDGSFNVWEVINKKSPKGLKKMKKLKKKENKPTVVEPEPEEVIIDGKTTDEVTPDATEETTEDIFGDEGTGESTGESPEVEGLTAKDTEKLNRDFKNVLKQHYTKKANTFKNVTRWMMVQPQFRAFPKGDERDAAVSAYLAQALEQGLYEFTNDEKTEVISRIG